MSKSQNTSKNNFKSKRSTRNNKAVLIVLTVLLVVCAGIFLGLNVFYQEQDTADASENIMESSSVSSSETSVSSSSSVSNIPTEPDPAVTPDEPDQIDDTQDETPIQEYRRQQIEQRESQIPQTPLDSSSIDGGVPIETAGGGLYGKTTVQTVRGNGDWIYSRTSTDGINWTNWSTPNGRTIDTPSQVVLTGWNTGQETIVQAVRGSGNWIYTRTSTDGVNWSPWSQPNGKTIDTPSQVVVYDPSTDLETIVQTVRGTDNWIYTRRSTDGVNWSPWSQPNGKTIDTPSQVVVWSDQTGYQVVQTVRGTGDWIYTRTSNDAGQTWTPWSAPTGKTIDTPSQLTFWSFSNFNDIVVQTVRGTGDWIYTRTSADAGNTWSPWSAPTGKTIDAPSQIMAYDNVTGDNHIVQTVRGTGDWIYTRTSSNGMNWAPWSAPNGRTVDTPSVISEWDIVVQTVRGNQDWIYTRVSLDAGRTWGGWSAPNGKTIDTPQQALIDIS
jgi:hypothetical protein